MRLGSTGVGVFRSPFIIFNAKHTGAGFPLTGNSGLKYRHVPHIFSGFDYPWQLLFPIVAPFPFVLCPAFIPWVPFRHFDPVYFYFGTGEHLAEKFRHCSHLLWDVERLRLLMLRANPPEPDNCRNPHSAQPRPAYRLL